MSLDRARNAIRGLMAMTPETASVLQADGSWQDIAAKTIAIGATVRVAPGERIPLDGELSKGQSSVNQAPITGESIPVAKTIGDKLFAGTINETGSFEYRVTAAQTDSTLSRIIHAVEEAQGSRAPTQRFVDSFAKVYTPIVFVLALGRHVHPSPAAGPAMDGVGVQGTGLAGDCLPMCAGCLYPGDCSQRAGGCGQGGHTYQRWRVPGRRPQAEVTGAG